jgi:phytanoyl-CoA hydroxylase
VAERNVRLSYEERGFVLVPGVIDASALDTLDQFIASMATRYTGEKIAGTQTEAFAEALLQNREAERRLYDSIRTEHVISFCRSESLSRAITDVLGGKIGLLGKIPVRIDLPLVTRELAVWHQDYFYVKGSSETVTAWIPLQDTPFSLGCLMVMPGSHKPGPIPHLGKALGKRDYPIDVYDREVRYVEMRRGDILLFHSFFLHSSSINLSSRARLSLQPRYVRLGKPTDPSMGNVIPLQ